MDILCKNCRYFIDYYKPKLQHRLRHYCKYIRGKFEYYKGEQLKLSTMEYLNNNADCPYYKKKWWRRK